MLRHNSSVYSNICFVQMTEPAADTNTPNTQNNAEWENHDKGRRSEICQKKYSKLSHDQTRYLMVQAMN